MNPLRYENVAHLLIWNIVVGTLWAFWPKWRRSWVSPPSLS